MKRIFRARNVCALASLVVALPSPVPVRADVLEALWAVKAPSGADPGDQPWMQTDSTARGVTSNPANGNVLIATGVAVSTTVDPPLTVRVLDRNNGAELHQLTLTGISGGTIRLDMIRAADDGAIYGGNLVTGTALTPRAFKLYRWANDELTTVPTVAFQGDPAGVDQTSGNSLDPQRWGDSLDVRGAGVDTQIVIAATTITNTSFVPDPVCIFTTTDGENFTPHLVQDVGSTAGNLSVAFGPDIPGYDDPATPETENLTLITIYTKRTGQVMRRIGVRPDTWQAVPSTLITLSSLPNSLGVIGIHVPSNRLAAIDLLAAADSFRVYDITDPNSPAVVDAVPVPTNNPNTNAVGSVDFFQPEVGEGALRIYFLDPNNGLFAYELQSSTLPPQISTHPESLTVIEGGRAPFTVTATGAPAPTYQWIKGDTDIPNATGATYTIDPTALTDAGTYRVRVTNSEGSALSDPATLTVTPLVSSGAMDVLWKLKPGDRDYLTASDNNQRGLGYNPELDHLILVSRTNNDTASLIVIDAPTGDDLGPAGTPRTLKLTNTSDTSHNVAGGFFVLNMVDCSDDGVVYATNLVTAGTLTPGFKIYSWSNDSGEAEPIKVYGPGDIFKRDANDTGDRAGDTFDVRGGGAGTQLLVGARNQAKFAILTTTDGLTFTPRVFELTGETDSTHFAQVAFGEGDTIWARPEIGPLRQVAFDMVAGTATELHEITNAQFSVAARLIAADPETKSLAAIAVETPDNLRLYDITDLAQPPVVLDQEFFETDNANGNFVGSIRFGGGRLFALDTNNGILAMTLNRTPPPAALPELIELAYVDDAAGDKFTFVLKGEVGATYILEGSFSLLATSWSDLQSITLTDPEQPIEFQVGAGQTLYFFRARPQ